MNGALIAVVLAIITVAALLLAGLGGMSAVLIIVAIAGAVYLLQNTRRA